MTGLGFGVPWLLLAGLAVAAPVAAHLARREDREGNAFPSLMFLRQVPLPTRSRRKLVDRALLALRMLAVLALVLGFAQPYLLSDDSGGAQTQRARVVVVDRSYSMAIGQRFEQARRVAQDALRSIDGNTRVALVAFDEGASTLSDFSAAPHAALQALQFVRPGNRATDLSKALTHASRLLSGAPVASRELILISDLQHSGLGADLVLASGIELQVRRIDDPVPGNLALLEAWYEESQRAQDAALSVHLRVAGSGDDLPASTLRVLVDGLPAAQQQLSLAARERHELTVAVFAARERATRVQLQIDDDALAIDNVRYLVIAPTRAINVLWIGRSSGSNAYVNAALSSSTEHSTQQWSAASLASSGMELRMQSVDVANIEQRQLDAADVIVLEGVMPNALQLAAAIRLRVEQGAGLLTVMDAVTQVHSQSVTQISGHGLAQADSPLAAVVAGVVAARNRTHAAGPGRDDATTIGPLLRDHAIAVALGDASLSGIAVWRYQALEARSDERVLAHFEDGSAAMLERGYGLGRSITMALPLDPQASNLVLDPVFVPLLAELLVHLSQRSVARLHYAPGDILDVARYAQAVVGADELAAALRAGRAVQLRTPSGTVQQVAIDESVMLAQTGFYELRTANAPPLPLAVNPVAAESLLDSLTVEQLRARIHFGPAPAATAPASNALERRDTRIAIWLIWLAVAALLAEASLAAWLGRRRAALQVAA